MGDNDTATLPVADLIAEYPSRKPNTLTAREGTAFTELLEQRGFGVAPDIRYSGINLSMRDTSMLPCSGYLTSQPSLPRTIWARPSSCSSAPP